MPEILTPIEIHRDVWVKRDDLYSFAGVHGGKVRTCALLARGATGLVTAGSRSSPQVNIVAHIAKEMGVPCRAHVPQGELGGELLLAREAGAQIIQHRAGYNSVIVARARSDALERGWTNIPFGMECLEAVAMTAAQVANLPAECSRVVVPVGSGMTLAGVLAGLVQLGRTTPVVGVVVGACPRKRLARYAPAGWETRAALVNSGCNYASPARDCWLGGLRLDSIYEAKCLPHLQPGDCFWAVGIHQCEVATKKPPGG